MGMRLRGGGDGGGIQLGGDDDDDSLFDVERHTHVDASSKGGSGWSRGSGKKFDIEDSELEEVENDEAEDYESVEELGGKDKGKGGVKKRRVKHIGTREGREEGEGHEQEEEEEVEEMGSDDEMPMPRGEKGAAHEAGRSQGTKAKPRRGAGANTSGGSNKREGGGGGAKGGAARREEDVSEELYQEIGESESLSVPDELLSDSEEKSKRKKPKLRQPLAVPKTGGMSGGEEEEGGNIFATDSEKEEEEEEDSEMVREMLGGVKEEEGEEGEEGQEGQEGQEEGEKGKGKERGTGTRKGRKKGVGGRERDELKKETGSVQKAATRIGNEGFPGIFKTKRKGKG